MAAQINVFYHVMFVALAGGAGSSDPDTRSGFDSS